VPTPIWVSGWEHGLATPVISGTGICSVVTGTGMSVQSTIKRTGTYALKGVGTSGEASITIGIPSALQTNVFAFTFYFRWETLPNIEISIARIQTSAGSTARINFDPADQKVFGRYVSDGTKVNQVLSQSTWYRIDCKADVSANPSKLWYNVNGVGEQYTEYAQAATVFNGYRFGFIESTPTINAGEAYWDDAVYSNTISDYPIGTCAVIGLRPNADGTHNNAANIMEDIDGNDIDGSTYYAYDKLDEDPWVSTAGTDYVRQTGNGTSNYCEIQFADTTETNIMGVMALLQYSSASTSSNTGGCIIRSGTTETAVWGITGALEDYSESSSFYKKAIVSPDGGSWTSTLVNALRCRFGYSGDANPDPYWQAIMLEVAYGPAGTSTSSSKPAFIKGQSTGTSTKQAYIKGKLDATPSTKAAYILGANALVGSKSAFIKGRQDTLSTKAAFAAGKLDATPSVKPAYIRGGINVNAAKSAYIQGTAGASSLSDSKSAFILGIDNILYPDADQASTGVWRNQIDSGTNLYQSIDETHPASDADWIANVDPVNGDYYECTLQNPGGTVGDGNCAVFWRGWDITDSGNMFSTVQLRQGASTVVASQKIKLSSTPRTYCFQLTSGERASITDWDDLRIRILPTDS
jgi:hypothetical protein